MPATILRASKPSGTNEPPAARPPAGACPIFLQAVVEEIEEGYSVVDRCGRLIAWNSRFIEFLDLPRDLKEGTPLIEILELQAARGDFGDAVTLAALDKRLADFFEFVPMTRERITPTGQIIHIRRRAMSDGSIITFYKDITEQRRDEAARNRAFAEAELASRSKSEFLAHMSHELRTPLNAIIGFSELIANRVLGITADEKYLEYVCDIHASGLLLLGIVNDVLDMSKIEAGKLELIFERIEIRPALEEAIAIVADLARRRHLDIALTVPSKDIYVIADERAFKQITLNILSNAIKFSDEGGRIEITAASHLGGLSLAIRDSGIGMTPEELERALQPFAQAKPMTTRTYGGTGLGLPIVKGLVEAHRGSLAIESAPGTGTVVRVTLPRDPATTVFDPRPVSELSDA